MGPIKSTSLDASRFVLRQNLYIITSPFDFCTTFEDVYHLYSSVMSFSRHSFYDIILMMNLPASEMEFLDKMILLHDYHLVALLAAPRLVTLALIVYSKRYYLKSGDQ